MRFAASPLAVAIALGLLSPVAFGDEIEEESRANEADDPDQIAASTSVEDNE